MLNTLLTFLAGRLREPFTWKGIFLVTSVFLGWNMDEQMKLAIMSLGMALAGGVDMLPDSFLNKQNDKRLENKIKEDLKPYLNTENNIEKVYNDDNLNINQYSLDFLVVARNQQILKYLGYYKGKIDGIWGKGSMQAKIDFEDSPDFEPGAKNFGGLFDSSLPLPKSIYYNVDRGTFHIYNVEDSLLPRYHSSLVSRIVSLEKQKIQDANPYEDGFNDR